MKRDQINGLKHNAKLDVRLPDQLKAEFLARCRKEGVSSGAVIRSMIIDYVLARPKAWPVMAAGLLKETLMKRSRLTLGGAVAAMAMLGAVVAPSATADELTVALDFEVASDEGGAQHSNRMTTEVRVSPGETLRIELPIGEQAAEWGFDLTFTRCMPELANCPLGGLDLEMSIERLSDTALLAAPRMVILEGQEARVEFGGEADQQIRLSLRADTVSE